MLKTTFSTELTKLNKLANIFSLAAEPEEAPESQLEEVEVTEAIPPQAEDPSAKLPQLLKEEHSLRELIKDTILPVLGMNSGAALRFVAQELSAMPDSESDSFEDRVAATELRIQFLNQAKALVDEYVELRQKLQGESLQINESEDIRSQLEILRNLAEEQSLKPDPKGRLKEIIPGEEEVSIKTPDEISPEMEGLYERILDLAGEIPEDKQERITEAKELTEKIHELNTKLSDIRSVRIPNDPMIEKESQEFFDIANERRREVARLDKVVSRAKDKLSELEETIPEITDSAEQRALKAEHRKAAIFVEEYEERVIAKLSDIVIALAKADEILKKNGYDLPPNYVETLLKSRKRLTDLLQAKTERSGYLEMEGVSLSEETKEALSNTEGLGEAQKENLIDYAQMRETLREMIARRDALVGNDPEKTIEKLFPKEYEIVKAREERETGGPTPKEELEGLPARERDERLSGDVVRWRPMRGRHQEEMHRAKQHSSIGQGLSKEELLDKKQEIISKIEKVEKSLILTPSLLQKNVHDKESRENLENHLDKLKFDLEAINKKIEIAETKQPIAYEPIEPPAKPEKFDGVIPQNQELQEMSHIFEPNLASRKEVIKSDTGAGNIKSVEYDLAPKYTNLPVDLSNYKLVVTEFTPHSQWKEENGNFVRIDGRGSVNKKEDKWEAFYTSPAEKTPRNLGEYENADDAKRAVEEAIKSNASTSTWTGSALEDGESMRDDQLAKIEYAGYKRNQFEAFEEDGKWYVRVGDRKLQQPFMDQEAAEKAADKFYEKNQRFRLYLKRKGDYIPVDRTYPTEALARKAADEAIIRTTSPAGQKAHTEGLEIIGPDGKSISFDRFKALFEDLDLPAAELDSTQALSQEQYSAWIQLRNMFDVKPSVVEKVNEDGRTTSTIDRKEVPAGLGKKGTKKVIVTYDLTPKNGSSWEPIVGWKVKVTMFTRDNKNNLTNIDVHIPGLKAPVTPSQAVEHVFNSIYDLKQTGETKEKVIGDTNIRTRYLAVNLNPEKAKGIAPPIRENLQNVLNNSIVVERTRSVAGGPPRTTLTLEGPDGDEMSLNEAVSKMWQHLPSSGIGGLGDRVVRQQPEKSKIQRLEEELAKVKGTGKERGILEEIEKEKAREQRLTEVKQQEGFETKPSRLEARITEEEENLVQGDILFNANFAHDEVIESEVITVKIHRGNADGTVLDKGPIYINAKRAGDNTWYFITMTDINSETPKSLWDDITRARSTNPLVVKKLKGLAQEGAKSVGLAVSTMSSKKKEEEESQLFRRPDETFEKKVTSPTGVGTLRQQLLPSTTKGTKVKDGKFPEGIYTVDIRYLPYIKLEQGGKTPSIDNWVKLPLREFVLDKPATPDELKQQVIDSRNINIDALLKKETNGIQLAKLPPDNTTPVYVTLKHKIDRNARTNFVLGYQVGIDGLSFTGEMDKAVIPGAIESAKPEEAQDRKRIMWEIDLEHANKKSTFTFTAPNNASKAALFDHLKKVIAANLNAGRVEGIKPGKATLGNSEVDLKPGQKVEIQVTFGSEQLKKKLPTKRFEYVWNGNAFKFVQILDVHGTMKTKLPNKPVQIQPADPTDRIKR